MFLIIADSNNSECHDEQKHTNNDTQCLDEVNRVAERSTKYNYERYANYGYDTAAIDYYNYLY